MVGKWPPKTFMLFAGGIKSRPLRWGDLRFPQGNPVSSHPQKRETGGSESNMEDAE